MNRRGTLGFASAAGTVAAAAWCAPATAPFVPWQCRLLRIERRLPDRRGVALTFDDGPHPKGTPLVLEHLARRGAQATFFLVGEQVERYPALAAEIADAGHEIAVHGYRHRMQLWRLPHALVDDLDRALDTIGRATGATPVCHRPPYGVYSRPGLALTRRYGLRPTLWSKWGKDWGRRETVESVVRRATDGLKAGDIVLLHDSDRYSSPGSWCTTAGAVPLVLEAIAETGTSAVSITHSM